MSSLGVLGVSVVGSAGAPLPRFAAVAVTGSPDRSDGFERWVVPELELLYRAALAVTRDHAEAEDLVQDTLIRAFRGIDGFDGAHPRAWLLTILRNTNISRHRRRRPELLDDPDRIEEFGEPTSSESGPEFEAMAGEFDVRVAQAFASLAPDHQTVIRLVDMDGLSYQEAACVLGVPIGTVMSRLHRGRRKIKRKLAGASSRGGRP